MRSALLVTIAWLARLVLLDFVLSTFLLPGVIGVLFIFDFGKFKFGGTKVDGVMTIAFSVIKR